MVLIPYPSPLVLVANDACVFRALIFGGYEDKINLNIKLVSVKFVETNACFFNFILFLLIAVTQFASLLQSPPPSPPDPTLPPSSAPMPLHLQMSLLCLMLWWGCGGQALLYMPPDF